MSLSPLLRKIFLVDLIKGLKVTFDYQKPSEAITEQYPLERPVIFERYRGLPRLNVNPETGESLCIVCNLCALACPGAVDRGEGRAQSGDQAQRAGLVELRPEPLHVLRPVRRSLLDRCAGTDPGLSRWRFYNREGMVLDQAALEHGQEPERYAK